MGKWPKFQWPNDKMEMFYNSYFINFNILYFILICTEHYVDGYSTVVVKFVHFSQLWLHKPNQLK
jgi:hypothetical protein